VGIYAFILILFFVNFIGKCDAPCRCVVSVVHPICGDLRFTIEWVVQGLCPVQTQRSVCTTLSKGGNR